MQATVTFTDRQGVAGTQTVQIDDSGDGRYYATALGRWGCGKNAATPEAAVRLLVQDMATIRTITLDTAKVIR